MKPVRMIVGLTIIALISAVGVRRAGATTLAKFDLDSIITNRTVVDISGNNHNATFNRDVTLSNDDPFNATPGGGPPGYVVEGKSASLSINPTQANLANPGTIDLNNGGMNKFTLEGWLKPTVVQGMTLLEVSSTMGGTTAMHLGMNSAGFARAQFLSQSSGSKILISSNAIPLNTWTHLAFVYDGGTMHLYMNAVEATNSLFVGQTVINSMSSAFFGGGGALGQVNGLIDDIRISNSALTPSQLGFYESFTPAMPEPSTMALLATGLLTLAWRRRR